MQVSDGTQKTITAGESYTIPPGHDAWVVGDEPCVLVDFEGMSDYAQREASPRREEGAEQSAPSVQ